MPSKSPRKRHYAITLQNPELDQFIDIPPPSYVTYVCWVLEQGEETGNIHYQIYAQCSKDVRFTQIQKWIPGCSMRTCGGSSQDNLDYIFGLGKHVGKVAFQLSEPEEWGCYREMKGTRGARNDMLGIKKMLEENKSVKEIATAFPSQYIRYHRGIAALDAALHSDDKIPEDPIDLLPWEQEVIGLLDGPVVRRRIIWIWSDASNSGKSSFATYVYNRYKTCNGMHEKKRTIHSYKRGTQVIWFDTARGEPHDAQFLSQVESLSDQKSHGSEMHDPHNKIVLGHIVVSTNRPPPYHHLPNRLLEIHAESPFQVEAYNPYLDNCVPADE